MPCVLPQLGQRYGTLTRQHCKNALQAAQREGDILQAEASASVSIPAFLSLQQRVASIQEPISRSQISVDEKISRLKEKLEENMKIVQDLVDTLK